MIAHSIRLSEDESAEVLDQGLEVLNLLAVLVGLVLVPVALPPLCPGLDAARRRNREMPCPGCGCDLFAALPDFGPLFRLLEGCSAGGRGCPCPLLWSSWSVAPPTSRPQGLGAPPTAERRALSKSGCPLARSTESAGCAPLSADCAERG